MPGGLRWRADTRQGPKVEHETPMPDPEEAGPQLRTPWKAKPFNF
jgi:hypothetical protein